MARLEEMVRFAIAAEYLLCEDASAEHDAPLRREQLAKTLAALTRCYRDARDDWTRGAPFPNEPEMLGYQLLLGLGADPTGRGKGRESAFGDTEPSGGGSAPFLRVLRGAPRRALGTPEIAFALAAKRAHDSGAAATFLNLVTGSACSFLQACCLHRHVNGARKHALRVASATRPKTETNADLFGDVGVRALRLDARFRGEEEDGGFRANVTRAAAAMTRACGLVVDEAAGTAALRRAPFADPAMAEKNDGAADAFRPRRERFVDAKAPAAKGGFFRWRALIEGKAGR